MLQPELLYHLTSGRALLAALVDFVQEALKDGLLQAFRLINFSDHLSNLTNSLFLVILVDLLQLHLVIKLLHLRLLSRVLLSIIFLQNLSLLGCGN